MHDKIVEFFKNNPNPEDESLHNWAEENKFNVHEVKTEIYKMATGYVQFITGGNSNKKSVTEKDINADELAKGIEVEKEHVANEEMAKKIALDHLSEIPDYYTRLKDMEDTAKSKTASYYELGYWDARKTLGVA